MEGSIEHSFEMSQDLGMRGPDIFNSQSLTKSGK